MAKGAVFIVVYSIILLALFSTFCYLMTTVNPPPINSDISENETAKLLEDFLPPLKDGSLSYGLEKYRPLKEDYNDDQQIASTEPLYVPLKVKDKANKLSVPISASTDHLDLKTATSITTEVIGDPVEMTLGIKKGKRRSINENLNSKVAQPGAVIVKIVDDTGNTKIEIKVEPDAFNENDIKDSTYYKNYKNKREYKRKDTIIKILPNNSLSLGKPESALLIDFARQKIISKSVTERKPELNTSTYPYTTITSVILQTLKNDKLVLFSATNSTEKYVTKSQRSTR